jgi:hypothetical protein|tara:strand:- start:195 stop:464 length:270 start_codon:yes stop_codon:yes gene_type:complete
MKYLIKFWDKKSLVVSEKVGEQVKNAKENGTGCIRIDQALYEVKAISYIEPIKEKMEKNLLPEHVPDPVKKETLERMKKEMSERFNWNS